MNRIRHLGVAAVVVGALALTGCTSGTHVAQTQIDQPGAKASGMRVGAQAVDAIPQSEITSVDTSPTGTWTNCDQPSQNLLGSGQVDYDNVYAWTGSIRVTPRPGADPGGMVRALAHVYEKKHPSWTTKLSRAGGDAFLQSYAPSQQGIDASISNGIILLDPQSQCFDAKQVLDGDY